VAIPWRSATPIYLSDEDDLLLKDIQDIAEVMRKTKRADAHFEERRAIALIEGKVGARLGIKDRAGMEFGA
jgi:hypothetical protein